MELKIYSQEERLTVAQILIKNGYTVGQRKKQRSPNGKSVDYFLHVEEDENNADTTRRIMKLQMTEDEIVKSYKSAKYPDRQVDVLADLNLCDKSDIVFVLKRSGIDVKLPERKSRPRRVAKDTKMKDSEETNEPKRKVPLSVYGVLTEELVRIEMQINKLGNRHKEISEFLHELERNNEFEVCNQ